MYVFNNGINGDMKFVNDNLMSETALDGMMLPLFQKIMRNCGVPEDEYCITFIIDDEPNVETYKQGNIELYNECESDMYMSACNDCRYKIYVTDDFIDNFTIYMEYLFRHNQ